MTKILFKSFTVIAINTEGVNRIVAIDKNRVREIAVTLEAVRIPVTLQSRLLPAGRAQDDRHEVKVAALG
jgi:hypothetical protein